MSVNKWSYKMFLMRPPGSSAELNRRRLLAIERYHDGYSSAQIADFLGVSERSVWRWLAASRRPPRPDRRPGRPPRLDAAQSRVVLRWLRESPMQFGFPTDLWTAARVGQLVDEVWGVRFHPRYLAAWLAERGCSPQKPRRVPRERNREVIDAWCDADWSRIQKTSASETRSCC